MSRRQLSATLGTVSARTLSESLLAVALVTGAYYLLFYVPKHLEAGQPVSALSHYFLTYAPIQELHQSVYVIPDSVPVWDTPAEIRAQVTTLQSEEQVYALGRFRDWTQVRMMDGREGWVNADALMSAGTHDEEERLRGAIAGVPVQATGHSADVDNLHVEPSRAAAVVAQVNPQQTLDIFARRIVGRAHDNTSREFLPESADRGEAWYLVEQGSQTGWILGRHVQLTVPKGISAYAQSNNLVAWLVLDRVRDGRRLVPQYLVAGRAGTDRCDFTDIRVLTWWKRKQTYAIAYKEDGLKGEFPILVTRSGSIPYFRLRLLNGKGASSQKVYGLFDTITRIVGAPHS